MSTTDKPKTYTEMLQRVQQARKSATAKDQADTEALQAIKDPAEKGKKETPSHPDGDSADKTKIPAKPSNTSKNDSRIPGENLHPAGINESGTKVPSTQDGNAREDAATSPTTDINKIASDVSARVGGILSRLENLQTKKASAGKGAAPKKVETDKQEQNKKAGEVDEATQQIDFDDVEFALKIASVVVNTEGGLEWVQTMARKQAGVAAAQEIAEDAAAYQDFIEKSAAEQAELEELAYMDQLAFEEQMQDLAFAYDEFTKGASEEDLRKIDQRFNVHTKIASAFDHEFEKQAYDAGTLDAAMLEDALAAEEELPQEASDLDAEDVIAIIEDAVMSGEIPEEVGLELVEQILVEEAEASDLDAEYVIAMIEDAVMSGEIPEEVGLELVEQILDEEAEFMDEGGMEEIPEEDLEAATMAEKMASEAVKD